MSGLNPNQSQKGRTIIVVIIIPVTVVVIVVFIRILIRTPIIGHIARVNGEVIFVIIVL
jgi:hypothetical protein